jgi:prephenate dehydrogenase
VTASSAREPLPDEAGAGAVVVVGLGVLGGSVARALRTRDPGRPIWGVDPDTVTSARALEAGVVDRVDPSGEALLAEASWIVLAVPLSAVPDLLAGPLGGLAAGPGDGVPRAGQPLLLDLVGLSTPVLNRAERAGLAHRWISGVPVLVTPDTGFGASDAGLLDGVEVILSTVDATGPEVRESGEGFWRTLGAHPTWMSPRDADARVAWTVLLPQLVSNALAGALHAAGVPPEDLGPQAAPMVALAATAPERWAELLEGAAPATGTGLGSVGRALGVVGDLLARREVDRVVEFMDRTRGWAAPDADPAPPSAEGQG